MTTRIAYLVNQYPKVSHSFIRREIVALEQQGFEIQRFALRGWDGDLVDRQDMDERERTRYVLEQGALPLLIASAGTALSSPGRFFAALRLAWRMAHGGDRSFAYHLVYLAEACRLLPWLNAIGAERLHAHFGTNSAEVAMLTHTLGGPPYSFTVHGPEEFDRAQPLKLGEKVRRSAFVVAISSYGRSQLFRYLSHCDWPKVHVVHCGIDTAFHAVPASAAPDVSRFVCVGRLCEQKGQLLLVEALGLLREQGVQAALVLAGDGEMRPEVEALTRRYGLAAQVQITGWVSGDRVRQEILAARAMVQPSFAEGLPVALMEAMALRRPVITTFVSGIPELVIPGENGWVVAAGAVEELAAAMDACLRTPIARLAEIGEANHKRVLERHAIDTEVGKLAAHFRRAPSETPA